MQIYHAPMAFGQQFSSSMVMCLAIDRFLAVRIYKRYRNFGAAYALRMISAIFFICIFNGVYVWLDVFVFTSLADVQRTTQICKLEKVISGAFFKEYSFARFAPCVVTPFLYLYTLVYLKFSRGANMREQDKKKQYKLTKNILIIVFNDFILMGLPFGYSFYAAVAESSTSSMYDIVNGFSISLSLFSASGNMFLYAWKYPKFRKILIGQMKFNSKVGQMTIVASTMGNFKTEFQRGDSKF